MFFLQLSYHTTRGNEIGTITTNKETRASESKEEPLSPEKRGFNKWWATKVSSSFLTPLTSGKVDKVGTLVFTLTLGIMPGVPSSMMPKVPKYGLCTAFLKVVLVFALNFFPSFEGCLTK